MPLTPDDILNRALTDSGKKLFLLQELINSVSRSQSRKEVITTLLDHLLDSSLFHFDYATFAQVDYLNEQITILDSRCASPIVVDPADWRSEKYSFPLDGNDVMSVAVREDRIIELHGDQFVDGAPCDLDMETYRKFKHDELLRLFIPVIARRKSGDSTNKDLSIGLLEVGCHISNKDVFNNNEKIELSIYADNIAQVYHKNYIYEERIQLRKKVRNFEENSKDHKDFMNHVVNDLYRRLHLDFAEAGFISFDDDVIWYPKNQVHTGDTTYKELRDQTTASFFQFLVKEKRPHLHQDEKHSLLILPVFLGDETIGVVSLCYEENNSFNEFRIKYAQDILSETDGIFTKLRLSSAIRNLVRPLGIYDKKKIYAATCQAVRSFFAGRFISFWENDINNKSVFRHKHIENALLEHCSDITKLTVSVKNEGMQLTIQQLGENHDPISSLEKFALKNGFKSIVYAPLKTYRGISSFIAVFSKKEISRFYPEDETFFNHLGTKASMSLGYADLLNFFNDLSSIHYDNSIDEILEPILDDVQKLSGADLLLLYRFDPEGDKFSHAGTRGILRDSKLEDRLQSNDIERGDFSYIVLEEGTIWVQNGKEYQEKYNKEKRGWNGGGQFQSDFWEREGIRSMAALRIEFGTETLGVIFFNYRKELEFNDDDRSLIQLLANSIGRVVAFSHSLTIKEKLEEEKTEQMASFAENELTRGFLHNTNNLMTFVGYSYEDLKMVIAKAGLDRRSLEAVNEKLDKLGTDILSVSKDFLIFRKYLKSEIQEIELCNLVDLVNEALYVVRLKVKERNIVIKNDIKKAESVYCDRLQVVHVILNLIKNAIEAKAKQIWLSCESKEERNKSENKDILFKVLEIKDNGMGIREEHRAKIFDAKFTTKNDGTGMGLPISKYILEKHGGRIDFKSVQGNFTTFNVYLPTNPEKQ